MKRRKDEKVGEALGKKAALLHTRQAYLSYSSPLTILSDNKDTLCYDLNCMRAVIQRVKNSQVKIEGEIIGEIGQGLLVLLGVGVGDTKNDIKYLADKILNLRIFSDDEGKMNLSVLDIGGEILVVSQFTLYADTSRGRRPSYIQAASPELAEKLYEEFVKRIKKSGLKVETGKFRAVMEIELVNDGPVTLILGST